MWGLRLVWCLSKLSDPCHLLTKTYWCNVEFAGQIHVLLTKIQFMFIIHQTAHLLCSTAKQTMYVNYRAHDEQEFA